MEKKYEERKIVVYADVREEKSGVPKLIEAKGILVVRKQLPVGDYIISGEAVVERKSAYDFAHSLFDGRLFDQASRLAESYPVVIYVVEGDPFRIRRFSGRREQLTAALTALILDFNVKIIYSVGPEHTASIIVHLAKRMQHGGRKGVVIHKKPKLSNTREWQLYILQSFPGIGPKTAERILERFGSIEAFVRASISEIARVPGIGEKKAEEIKRILIAKYSKSAGKKPKTTLDDFV